MLNEDQNTGVDVTPAITPDTTPNTTPDTASDAVAPETSSDDSVSPPEFTVGDALKDFDSYEKNKPLPVTKPDESTTDASPVTKPNFKPRVYDGLDPHERQWFSKMGNEAYKALYPKYLEQKKSQETLAKLQEENEQLKGSHFFEHDGAWTLTPEYQELSQANTRIAGEVDFWQQQLASILGGNPHKVLELDENGKVVVSAERESTPEAHALVLRQLNKAQLIQNQLASRFNEFATQFKTKHSDYINGLKGVAARIFKGVDPAKLEAAASKELAHFPAYVRGKPEVQLLAQSLVLIQGLVTQINKLQAGNSASVIKSKTVSSSGPAGVASSGAAKEGTVKAVLDQFRQYGL